MPINPVQIHSDLLDQVVKEARASERRRINFNFHQLQDPANRMLNAIEPESYIHPIVILNLPVMRPSSFCEGREL